MQILSLRGDFIRWWLSHDADDNDDFLRGEIGAVLEASLPDNDCEDDDLELVRTVKQ